MPTGGRFIWDRAVRDWVPLDRYVRARPLGPVVWSDLPAYKSPLGTGLIDGRKARREDLARGGCREVDPSEFKAVLRNPEFARKIGREVGGDPLPKPQRLPTWVDHD